MMYMFELRNTATNRIFGGYVNCDKPFNLAIDEINCAAKTLANDECRRFGGNPADVVLMKISSIE